MRHTTVNQESPSWGTPSSWWKISFSYQEVIGKLITSHTLYISLIWFDLPHFLWPRPLCWAFSWGTFVANAFFVDRFLDFFWWKVCFVDRFFGDSFWWTVCFVDRFLGDFFLVKGLCCRPFFWWTICFVDHFLGACSLVKGLFCRPCSWRMLFGERLVL